MQKMQKVPRTRRIGEQLRDEIAQLMRSEMQDPRIAMVSITTVIVVRDLSQATVFITYIGPSEQRTEILEQLNHYGVVFRKILGKRLRLRIIPKLLFEYDEVVERGAALSSLISQAVAHDQAKAQQTQVESEQVE